MAHLPPYCIRNPAGEYRTMVGWSRFRGDALSFDDEVSAKNWINATPLIAGTVAREPFDTDRQAVERAGAGLMPAVNLTTGMAQSDYDPVP